MDGKGKVAIVTGSATGVGAEVARQLAERGCNVVINYTKSETEARESQAACDALGVETLLVQADVSVDADCRRMAQAALDKWGRIDVLVNNAGTSKFVAHDDLEGLTAEDFQRIYAVNVIGPYQMTRACAPAMQKQGAGSVVNISSLAGVRGVGSSIAYAASKGALNNMTMSLARALGPEIRVNTVCPGFIVTRWLRTGLGEERFEQLRQSVAKAAPLKAASTPSEVAEPVIYFALSARHTTGETLLVDAGTHLGQAMRVQR
jgi:3-oxoacyl-[acyl-carrier protein] reductase